MSASRRSCGRRVEQALGSIEPPGRGPRERPHLVGTPIRRPCRDPLGDGLFRQPVERDELAAGEDRRRQRTELARDEHDRRVRRRLLEVLEQRVRGVVVHPLRVEDEIHAAVRLERPHVQVVPQGANVVDPDHLAERLQRVQVGVRPRLDASCVPEERCREGECGDALPDARRAVQKVSMRGPVRERGLEQNAWPRAAQGLRRSAPYTSSAISSGGSEPSSDTIRSGNRVASSR